MRCSIFLRCSEGRAPALRACFRLSVSLCSPSTGFTKATPWLVVAGGACGISVSCIYKEWYSELDSCSAIGTYHRWKFAPDSAGQRGEASGYSGAVSGGGVAIREGEARQDSVKLMDIARHGDEDLPE